MRSAIVLAAVPLALTALPAAAQSLDIRDAAVRVTVIPEARADVVVQSISAHPNLPLKVKRTPQRVIIVGDLGRRIRGCAGDGPGSFVTIAGLGAVPYAQLPQVVVRAPRDVRVASGGAVFGLVGRAASVDLGNAGCGDWVVADTQGTLRLTEAGSGDIRAGAAGSARLRVAGQGDLAVGAVRGAVDAEIGGAGDIDVRSMNGPLVAKIAGSGDVRVAAGHASLLTASVAGPGSVYFAGVADALKAQVVGSGDVHVARVTGPVTRSVLGSGKVRVGGPAGPVRP